MGLVDKVCGVDGIHKGRLQEGGMGINTQETESSRNIR